MSTTSLDLFRVLHRGHLTDQASVIAAPSPDARTFHRRVSDDAMTTLAEAPAVAERLGVERLFIKDESTRMGTYAFKVLGASWAIFRTLSDRAGAPADGWRGWDDLAEHFASLGDVRFISATDGNHGHAVASVAAHLGFRARILLPAGAPPARMARLRETGAEVISVDGNYDETVDRAKAEAADGELLVSDTAWPGYEQIPTWISDGYETLFAEADEQMPRTLGPDDLAVSQVGVGALAAAAVRHFRHRPDGPTTVGVEALTSACVMASVAAGFTMVIPGDHATAMDGLAAGEPSLTALPILSAGMDVFVAAGDELALEAATLMADAGVRASPTGAAGLAALLALSRSEHAGILAGRRHVLVVNTEAPL